VYCPSDTKVRDNVDKRSFVPKSNRRLELFRSWVAMCPRARGSNTLLAQRENTHSSSLLGKRSRVRRVQAETCMNPDWKRRQDCFCPIQRRRLQQHSPKSPQDTLTYPFPSRPFKVEKLRSVKPLRLFDFHQLYARCPTTTTSLKLVFTSKV